MMCKLLQIRNRIQYRSCCRNLSRNRIRYRSLCHNQCCSHTRHD